ncbi:MAG TPA: response regulator [Anaerolineaceae bacterium]
MVDRGKPIAILMAEDDPDDRLFCREALEQARLTNRIYFVEDGQELMDYLQCRGKYSDPASCPTPGLILLDLNMPRKDGREVLEELKTDDHFRPIPVVILTTSKAEEDILRSYELGVSGYITKPVTFERLVEIMRVLGRYWFEIVELPNL